MRLIRQILTFVEYLSIAGILILIIMFFTGSLGYGNIKTVLTVVDILVTVFIFLNCTDDYKTPFEKLFRFIGWLVLLVGIFLIFVIHEGIGAGDYWSWLNTILILGLFAAQLSEINEMKRTSNILSLLNFIVVLVSFTLLMFVIHGNPMNFILLFSFLGLNLILTLGTVFTGKLK